MTRPYKKTTKLKKYKMNREDTWEKTQKKIKKGNLSRKYECVTIREQEMEPISKINREEDKTEREKN